MLIGQLTDIHIGFDRSDPREANLIRLEQTVAHIAAQPQRPDLLLLTGDLTEHGDALSYARLQAALAPLRVPVWPVPGNHDLRAGMLAAFPQVKPMDGGFVQYALDLPGLRSWPLKRFPYLVFYVEHADHVDVWRVLHQNRDIPVGMQQESPEA